MKICAELFLVINHNSSRNLTSIACEVLAALLSSEDDLSLFCEEGFLTKFVNIIDKSRLLKSEMLIVVSQIAGPYKRSEVPL